jgi:hypothetical protein
VTKYEADDAAAINKRMEEIQAERWQRIQGTPLDDAKPTEPPSEIDWTKWNTGGFGSYVG